MASTGTSASKRQERFHGAFTGGFSAGFYNSVGSAEGWTPSTFSSSRDKRAAPREQRPEDFMDDEDGLLTEQLQARPEFDTLGSTADEVARQHAEKEAAGAAIPGPAPSELVLPVGDSMGKKLLRTMGWREGQGVGSRVRRKRSRPVPVGGNESPEEDFPEQARAGLGEKARQLVEKEGLTFAPKNIDMKAQTVVAKTNLHGVGHDPFKDAPEFAASRGAGGGSAVGRRAVYSTGDLVQPLSDAGGATAGGPLRGPLAATALSRGTHGFVLDDGEDDVYETGFGKESYDDALDAEGGDASGAGGSLVGTAKAWALGGANGEGEESMLASRRYARCPSDGRLPPAGFVVARRPDSIQKHWPPPVPPANFNPMFKFEEVMANPLRIPTSQGQSGPALDACGRARLLGESTGRPSKNAPAPATAVPDQDLPLPQDSPALSFLSPTARKKLLDAARGARTSSATASLGKNSPIPPVVGAGGAGYASRFTGVAGNGGQEPPGDRKEGLQFKLANRFTSEASSAPAGQADLAPLEGVAPTTAMSRPAGLSLRPPARPDASSTSSSAHGSVAQKIGDTNAGRTPVRSSFGWTPAPLLCKRLNVPVPSASSAVNWTSNAGQQGAGGSAVAADQELRGPLGRFVPDSSASRQPKVPLLEGMEQRHPIGASSEARASNAVATVDAAPPAERPPIDLFKSIFESESESESEDDDESGGESQAAASETLYTASKIPVQPNMRGGAALGAASTTSLRHGYGSDSSEDSTIAPEMPFSRHRPVRQKEEGGSGHDENPRRHGRGSIRDASDSERDSDMGNKKRSSSSSGTKRSGSKRKHKQKHQHKGNKAEKKHRKHQHKRKKSSSSRR